MDYWYRSGRGRSHPSLRNTSVLVGSLLAHGANYTISVAAAVGDQERIEQLLKKDAGLARRLDSARASPLSYAAREGHLHIVRLLLGAEGKNPGQHQGTCAVALSHDKACSNSGGSVTLWVRTNFRNISEWWWGERPREPEQSKLTKAAAREDASRGRSPHRD